VRPCLLVPIYDHGDRIGGVLAGLAKHGLPCLVVDDGSGPETRAALRAMAEAHPFVEVLTRPANGGKGVALREGFRAAAERGMSHVLHLDADGQHDPADVPRFLSAMRERPEALVLGRPVFDGSAPRVRLASRQLSVGLVWLATLSTAVADPLCGFRGVPLAPALRVIERVRTGDRMDFEPELAVRLFWEGVPVVNVPTRVVYPPGGLSHFDALRDGSRLAWLYVRLAAGMLGRAPALLSRRA
jgi:glycosyltransferase involved in cell wall biosynthesis